MKIVTGYRGEAHITSDDEQAYNIGVWGYSSVSDPDHVVVLGTGNTLSATKTGSLQATVRCGDAVCQGVHFRIPYGETEVLTFSTVGSGYYRKDLVAFHYTKTSGDDQESMELAIIEGTPATTRAAAALPTVTTGNIYQGARDVYIPFLSVELSSGSIDHVLRLENVHENGGFRSLEVTQAYDAGRIDDVEDDISAITGKMGNLELTRYYSTPAGTFVSSTLSAGVYLVICARNSSAGGTVFGILAVSNANGAWTQYHSTGSNWFTVTWGGTSRTLTVECSAQNWFVSLVKIA